MAGRGGMRLACAGRGGRAGWTPGSGGAPSSGGRGAARPEGGGTPRAERGRSRREGRVIMKNVLLLLDDDPGREARLQAALDVARALDGLLMCFETAGVAADAGAFEPAGAGREELEERLAKENVPWTI